MKRPSELSDDELAAIARQAARLPEVPQHVVERAIRLDASLPQRPEPLRDLAQALRAVLRVDSWSSPAFASGLRGGDADVRHLLFGAGDRDIDLRVAPTGGRFAVRGQVLGPDESGIVELAAVGSEPGSPPRAAVIDGLGEFRFDDVAAGSYCMTVRVGTSTIQLPDLAIGERPR